MITLHQLRAKIEGLRAAALPGDAELLDTFVDVTAGWLDNEATVEDLVKVLQRTLGHVWFSSRELHQQVFRALADFEEMVASVHGMTMNERLETFGLFMRWNTASGGERARLYDKVLAHR